MLIYSWHNSFILSLFVLFVCWLVVRYYLPSKSSFSFELLKIGVGMSVGNGRIKLLTVSKGSKPWGFLISSFFLFLFCLFVGWW